MRFSGGRVLEILVKQHAEMLLLVKHVADKQKLFFSDATVDIAIPSPCTASSHAFSVKAFRWRIWGKKNSLGPLDPKRISRAESVMRPTDKATADSRSVQSYAIVKNTGHGNFVIGRFYTRARNGLFV